MNRRDDWATPRWLFDELDREFCFTFDAAAQAHNAKCPEFSSDSLELPWHRMSVSSIWCNPPYGQPLRSFVEKAVAEARLGAVVVMLLPVRTESPIWHELIFEHAAEIRFVRNRVAFVPPPGTPRMKHGNRPVMGSSIVVFRPRTGPLVVRTMDGRRNSRLLVEGQTEIPLAFSRPMSILPI